MKSTAFRSIRYLTIVAFCVIACEGDDGQAPGAAERTNFVENGDFHIGDDTGPVTTTSVGVPPGSLPKDWYGGPGAGATATYEVKEAPGETRKDGEPERYLRVSWSTPPSADWPGETHHQPVFRFTFLEYFGIQDLRALGGKSARFSFRARVVGEPVDLIPILWHSYDASTPGIVGIKGKGYELFESSGEPGVVAVASGEPNPKAICWLSPEWKRYERIITLPDVEGKSITAGHYTGVGFDLHARCAPTIDVADISVEPLDVTE